MPTIRPDLLPAYESLYYRGEQFLEPHTTAQLDELTFAHPRKGITPIKIDTETLAEQGAVYTGNPVLQAALREYGIDSQVSEEASDLLSHYLSPGNESLVWGFSGYATGGIDSSTGKPYGYQSEAEGLLKLYDHLLANNVAPSLALDGGVSEGFLALSSIVARSVGVPTLGFIPRQGLASVGVRDHMVIAGDTYKDRETLVGTADMLVFGGGAEGTVRECVYAMQRGAAGLILKLTDYPPSSLPNTFMEHEELRQAYRDDRLVVCDSLDAIADSTTQLLEQDVTSSRSLRRSVITDFLTQDKNR